MASEEKQRINAKIPQDLYDFITGRYDSITEAVIAGLEKIRSGIESENRLYDQIEDLRTQIQLLYDQLHTKDLQIQDLNELLRKQTNNYSVLVNEIKPMLEERHQFTVKLLAEQEKRPVYKKLGFKNPFKKGK